MARSTRRVIFEGRVQGVGFRATTARLASRFPVAGHVRNLDDGRVELDVAGDDPAVESFLAAVRAAFAGSIRRESIADLAPGPVAPASFTIID